MALLISKLQPYVAKLKTNRGRGELVLAGASWYAGAHYGPQAKTAVENYGPYVLSFLANLVG